MLKSMIGLFALVSLAACSFAPVYGDASSNSTRYNLAFAEPDSRLEQVVYTELKKTFGNSSDPNAVRVTVRVSSSGLSAGTSSVSVKGDMVLTRASLDGSTASDELYTASRTATVTYDSSASQSLAAQSASNEAAERGALELAQNLRLTLLSVLPTLPRSGSVQAPTSN